MNEETVKEYENYMKKCLQKEWKTDLAITAEAFKKYAIGCYIIEKAKALARNVEGV